MATFFGLPIDEDLAVMSPNQDLFDITTRVLTRMRDTLRRLQPDMILTQGDTTTVMAASLAAFYLDIPVGHVEAGLRTGNMRNPFPEELNRVVTDAVSSLHFAPTPQAREALLRSGIPEQSIHVTGNTVIDALFYTLDKLATATPATSSRTPTERVILLTTHRRESFGPPHSANLRGSATDNRVVSRCACCISSSSKSKCTGSGRRMSARSGAGTPVAPPALSGICTSHARL